jgi:hypothetical protein
MKKLRKYKGFVFDPVKRTWDCGDLRYRSAAEAIAEGLHNLTDYDHAELMRLKAEPYEPVPKLEDVLHDAYAEWFGSSIASLALPQFIANRLRAVFPHIDQEER